MAIYIARPKIEIESRIYTVSLARPKRTKPISGIASVNRWLVTYSLTHHAKHLHKNSFSPFPSFPSRRLFDLFLLVFTLAKSFPISLPSPNENPPIGIDFAPYTWRRIGISAYTCAYLWMRFEHGRRPPRASCWISKPRIRGSGKCVCFPSKRTNLVRRRNSSVLQLSRYYRTNENSEDRACRWNFEDEHFRLDRCEIGRGSNSQLATNVFR